MARSDVVTDGPEIVRAGSPVPRGPARPALPMVVGPSRPAPSVLARMAEPAPPINDPAFLAELRECLGLVRRLTGAGSGLPVVFPGTGTTGMEALVTTLLRPGVPVVVLSTGMWGNRWTDICLRAGVPARTVVAGLGSAPDLTLLDRLLGARRHQAVLVTHVDSSSGVRVPVDEVAAVAARHGVLAIVDGVAAIGAEHVSQAAWGIDAYLAATPKAIAAPAGLAMSVLGPRALEVIAGRDWEPAGYSLDLASWVPVMRAADRGEFAYFQTPAGNLVGALTEALRLIEAEGAAERVDRHRRLRDRLTAGLDELGIAVVARHTRVRSHGITVGVVPAAWSGQEFVDDVARAGVIVQTGSHPAAASRTFRIGHLGNVTEADVDRTLQALRTVVSRGDDRRNVA